MTAIQNREDAAAVYRGLVLAYGLRWTAQVPPEAWAALARCLVFLPTEADRRWALGWPTTGRGKTPTLPP